MTAADLIAMFVLGLAGSVHCVQMCGPLVLSFDLTGSGGFAGHAKYHLGRLITYSALGALAGSFGHVINLAWASAATVAGGVAMIAAGLVVGRAVTFGPAERLVQISPITRWGGKLMRTRARFASGLVLGLLPCGLIYAAVLKSASTGSAASGGLEMAAFAAGTAGPLLGLGAFSAVIPARFRNQKLAAAGIAIMGAVLIWRGVSAPAAMCGH